MIARRVEKITQTDNGYIEIITDKGEARLWVLSDDVIRLRFSFDRKFEEASYALVTTAWEDIFDTLFKGERKRIKSLSLPIEEDKKEAIIKTSSMTLVINKDPFYVTLKDRNGNIFYEDLPERSYEIDFLGRISHYSRIDGESDHFYGFGEKNGGLDKKGKRMRMMPRDAIATDPENGDPMYKHIPFYIRTNDISLHSLGIFYNNSYDCVFDMGNERSGYWDRYCYYQADGGDLDIFFINGPDVKDIVERYTWLTGRTIMPTKQSLGFIDSTMYYCELPENCDREILKVMDKFEKERLPIDGFWLASGYTSGEDDGLRYFFNWNKKRFPDPDKFIKEMEERGIQVIPNTKPGILPGHPMLERFKKNDVFIKEADGKDDYIGKWWGGRGRFVDFTSEKGRGLWKELQKESLLSKGVHTIWNDNCEYDGVEDRNARCDKEGMGGTMAELKVIQSNMMALMATEVLREVYPGKRPYVTNRSGYAGIQRYAQVWGGDNVTAWATLKYNTALIIGMGLSGVANTGCDIGGFAGPAPEGELLLRWFQNGIFQPRFCLNSANSDNTVTQPWSYPEYMDMVRDAFRIRYTLFIYLYSLMYEAHEKGTPAWRALFMEFPHDKKCYSDDSLTFLFGPSILVGNVLEKGATTRTLYLPEGTKWYDMNDNWKEYEGGRTITVPVTLSSIPMFQRGGSIIVSSEDIKKSTRDKAETITVTVTPESDSIFILYDDDGVSENGEYVKTAISVKSGRGTEITISSVGDYPISWNRIYLNVLNKEKGAFYVTVDGEKLTQYLAHDDWEEAGSGWVYDLSDRFVRVKFDRNNRKEISVVVSFEKFDLIAMNGNTEKCDD